jgi:hypothetical protein
MILIDTSVLIDYFRSKDVELLRKMRELDAAVCGVTRAEILCGARDDLHYEHLANALDALNQVSISDTLWDDIGETLALLRRSGVTVPFTDAVITTVAVASGLELWTRDKQFSLIQSVIPQLRLLNEHPTR